MQAMCDKEVSVSTTIMNPSGPLIVHPLMPHQLTDEVTKLDDVFTLCHLGVARLEAEHWRLRIDGLVDTPLSLSLSDLQDFNRVEVESIHQCQGSPLDPNTPTRRISNVRWSGVRLSEVLSRAGSGSRRTLRLVLWRGLRNARRDPV